MNAHHKNENELKLELQQVQAAKSNPARFDVLYDRYYKSIFVFVYRRTGNEDLTADITSQVFLKALINIRKYEYKGVPFSAWLFRIAFNEINMYFRKNNADRVVSLERSNVGALIAEVQEEDNSEQQSRMMAALKQMGEEDLQLIELRFFEKRSFAEVGNIIGITENNAKVKLYRTLDKIKKLMGGSSSKK
ncbi:MAG: polymerase, sigma-24 subunit, subfamily [Bacteroidetes bacterium]|nr:polymerase, sigma-24 subunit, subfamily [Bacteroidota bacterium]